MIEKDEVMALLLVACPSFRDTWEEHQADWEDRDLLYLDLGAFARHLVTLVRAGDVDELPAVFEVVERLHVEGTRYVQEAATIGLLEDIQNQAERVGLTPDHFLPFLGPMSREWWKELNAFWSGTIEHVGETYTRPDADGGPAAG